MKIDLWLFHGCNVQFSNFRERLGSIGKLGGRLSERCGDGLVMVLIILMCFSFFILVRMTMCQKVHI